MPHRWRTVLAVAGLPRVAVRQPPTRLERHHLGEVDQAHDRLARRRQQDIGGRHSGGRIAGGRRRVRGLRRPAVGVVHEEQRDTDELVLEEPGEGQGQGQGLGLGSELRVKVRVRVRVRVRVGIGVG